MPSVSSPPPTGTEARKRAGFQLTKPFSGFWPTALNFLGLGRSGDMTKPGNVGAPRPMNTLSNSGTSSRTPYGVASSSRSFPSSPPPSKRQKLEDSGSNTTHSRATFAVINPASPRKRSIGSVSIPDSQRSVASNMSTSQAVVPEFREVDKHLVHKRKRSRTNRSGPRYLGREGVESPRSRPNPYPKSDDDDTDDEVHFINPKKARGSPRQEDHDQLELTLSDLANRFAQDPKEKFKDIVDMAEKSKRRGGRDSSPDELALGQEVIGGRPLKRYTPTSASLSKRGNIPATKFTGASFAGPPIGVGEECRRAVENKRDAESIIGSGLRVLRGACGQCKYEAGCEEDPDPLFLAVREIGHTLQPVDQGGNFLLSYRYLTLDINHVQAVLRASDEEQSCIVHLKLTGANLTNSAGPVLLLEFASKPEFSKFVQWVALYRKGSQIHIKDCKRAKLEKDLDEMMQRAKLHRIITDANADDIKVMRHNHNSRVHAAKDISSSANESKTQSRLRNAMQPSPTSRDRGGITASSPSRDDRLAPARRQTRKTRSIFSRFSPPEPGEPEYEAWTLLNPGWEKRWRNSLVYPATGKNRATIDKDDIQRLDEGQFLNDNIIIFYLRYLQKNLEDNNKDLAKRIFFQNTFFFDKLKPTKAGQGINYDSVRTWTSKVDLFSKDYIIVPINEYTHWYVAIICNAPALLSSSAQLGQVDGSGDTTAVNLNSAETHQESSGPSSHNEAPGSSMSNGVAAALMQQDVVENMRRMSIDSSDELSLEHKQVVESSSIEEEGSTATKNDHEVYELKDTDNSEAGPQHIRPAVARPIRKKAGKRPIMGPPKCDPNQPRIITLDSLGATHSPTCTYLKQYLIAECKDKKGIDITAPRAMGTTAKDIPEQTNHCDCGLFLLGYIQQFLLHPDEFVQSILQRDNKILWRLDPSALRNSIRELIFNLQKDQQERENAVQERKLQAKRGKSQTRAKDSPSHATTPATDLSVASSTPQPAHESTPGDKEGGSESPRAPPSSRPSSSRAGSAILGEPMATPTVGGNADHPIARTEMVERSTRKDGSRNVQEGETSDSETSDIPVVRKVEAKLRTVPHTAASPRKIEPAFDFETYHVPAVSSGSPSKVQFAKCHSLSPVAEGVQNGFLPLLSETSSSKGSRGATPLDPVVLDDSDNNKDRVLQSPQKHREEQKKSQLIVEIPSTSVYSRSPKQGSKTDDRKQTGRHSHHFINRQDGERVTGAKLRENPQNDVIDLSDD